MHDYPIGEIRNRLLKSHGIGEPNVVWVNQMYSQWMLGLLGTEPSKNCLKSEGLSSCFWYLNKSLSVMLLYTASIRSTCGFCGTL